MSVDLGSITNREVINRFVSLPGKFVLDIGCGNLGFSAQLVESGARVLGVDPDPVQSELNRAADLVEGLEFVEGLGEKLPLDDDSVDGVFFAYSLHHIPEPSYPRVFAEVVRVLRTGGFLYVIEPIGCPLNDVMRLFHDEEQERAAAQTAMRELAVPHFATHDEVIYHGHTQYDSFEHFVNHFGDRSFNAGYSKSDIDCPEVHEAFERLGAPDYRFEVPRRANIFRNLVTK